MPLWTYGAESANRPASQSQHSPVSAHSSDRRKTLTPPTTKPDHTGAVTTATGTKNTPIVQGACFLMSLGTILSNNLQFLAFGGGTTISQPVVTKKQTHKGRVRDIPCQGKRFAIPSLISAVTLNTTTSNTSKLVPEKLNDKLEDDLASTITRDYSCVSNSRLHPRYRVTSSTAISSEISCSSIFRFLNVTRYEAILYQPVQQ